MELLKWVADAPRLGVPNAYVIIRDQAVFCTAALMFDIVEKWVEAVTHVEQGAFKEAGTSLMQCARLCLQWSDEDSVTLKARYPIAFHEHAVWLCGNFMQCSAHFKIIETIPSHKSRGGLFRGLQARASKTSPYGGFETKVIEQELTFLQMRCLEEAKLASAHHFLETGDAFAAAAIIANIQNSSKTVSKKVQLFQETLKIYAPQLKTASVPLYTHLMLVDEIEPPF
jgi:hypothetical protein